METNIPVSTIAIPAETRSHVQDMQPITAKPVSASDRIKTIDIIRGVALCGILMMNIPGKRFSQPLFAMGTYWREFASIAATPGTCALIPAE